MNTKLRQFFIFFIGLGVSIGLDQFTKHLAVVHLKGQKPFVLIKGVFEFYYSENRGAAFGMLQGKLGLHSLSWIITISGKSAVGDLIILNMRENTTQKNGERRTYIHVGIAAFSIYNCMEYRLMRKPKMLWR